MILSMLPFLPKGAMNSSISKPVPLYDDFEGPSCTPLIVKFLRGISIRPERQLPHRHPYYELFWFSRGTGTFLNDTSRIPFSPGTLGFVAPGRVHYWETSRDAEGWLLAFKPELLRSISTLPPLTSLPIFSYLTKKPLVKAIGKDAQDIQNLIDSLVHEFTGNSQLREPSIQSLMSLLLIHCSRLFPSQQSHVQGASRLITQRFMDLLDESIPAIRQVQEYAAELHITPHRLIECVKECTGQTAGSLIEERLLTEAKRLLLHTGLTMAEIAYNLGFKDPSHFGHFFKRHTGHSPGMERRLTAQSPPKPSLPS